MFSKGTKEVRGTGVWSAFKMSRSEDGKVQFGDQPDENERLKDEKRNK